MWLIVAVPIVALLVTVMVVLRQSRRTVVLGVQFTEASERERLHRQRFAHLPSPLPQAIYASHEATLIDPEVSDLDRELRLVCSRLAASSADDRGDFRNAATLEDFYTLINFASRASVFALRDRDEKWIQETLMALAVIDATRIDERDLLLALSLVHHAAERLQLPPLEMFDAAALLAEPRTSEMIRSFVRQSRTYKDIQSSWGYQEIQGPRGAGFVRSDFDAYEPTLDLFRVALAIREAIERDRYQGDVKLATKLPSVWFPAASREKAESILARSPATASVTGSLRLGEHDRADVQLFLIFVVETRTGEDATALHALAGTTPLEESVTTAVRSGRLFALVIARSVEFGVASYETIETIKRFEGSLLAALQEADG